MKIFNEVKIEVLYYEKSVITMAFYKGLLPKSKLYHSLVKTKLETMAEVLKHTQKYIDVKQELEAKRLKKTTNSNQRTNDDSKGREDTNRSIQ